MAYIYSYDRYGLYSHVVMAYLVTACIVMAHMAMAYIYSYGLCSMTYIDMAYIL